MTDPQKRQLLIAASAIAAIMLVGALAEWPYGYFVLLRWVVSAAAVMVAVLSYLWQRPWAIVVFAFVALLFNPLAPVHLSRGTWLPLRRISSPWGTAVIPGREGQGGTAKSSLPLSPPSSRNGSERRKAMRSSTPPA